MRASLGMTSVLLALLAFAVRADSWLPPSVRHYPSATSGHVFIVEPNLMSGAVAEFPKGRLVTASGELVWERRLLNEVAPVSALVSADARFVVTFDNWQAVGYGRHVLVIYDADGQLIRSLTLSDIVGASGVKRFRASIGSRWWAGEHHFESPQVLALQVYAEGSSIIDAQPRFDIVRVRLQDGAVLP